ncbi:monooxygenase [Aspergillus sclerotialis]|uniref:Monooxygenase n=1 Tax=Aspergillus sclerotialis TaxID=2070753 RepID=A0A3A2Z9W2_9EURO|nr:monooxygenase [Aspergillus sclerotialis]
MTSTQKNDHIVQLPQTPPAPESLQPRHIAQNWLTKLESILTYNDTSRLGEIFHKESWWRDMLALEWEFHTLHTLSLIQEFLTRNQPRSRLSSFRLQDQGKYQPNLETPSSSHDLRWISSMFFFETNVGYGSGILRLTQNSDGEWKAYAVYTSLQELKGVKEPLGTNRVSGTLDSMPGGSLGGTWSERRKREFAFTDQQPTVLIIGAGQAGLNLGARLQSLGVSCLIIDKNDRVGDNWRKRYRTLVTHDPAEFTHMAYLPFPKNWPQFTPKDKLGDWFEAYSQIMELNVWTKTTITNAEYDDITSKWTINLTRNGSPCTVRPHHVALCTGHAGEPQVPSFPGQEKFNGVVYHGNDHKDASQYDVRGKKTIIVGTGNSGHDIAQNFYENGADVTMIQRSGTYVLTIDKGVFIPPTEEADVVAESLPYPVMFALGKDLTKRIAAAEKENVEGLQKAGFKFEWGVDQSGIARLYYTRGGGYYVDVGCSKLIIDKKIKVHQSPNGISGFKENALVLADGTELDADIVVLATGYDNMRTSARKIMGDKVADRCNDVWDLDEEGELNTMWRPSGHPNFWFMGGNLAICRIYSKLVALQIKAAEMGLSPSPVPN